ncbi:PAAR domain-containing protein [Burkholderia multivorans]|uniref:PAAR domain-containing protein n=1 Tax=Burkholderia multivorans TaxID=87883 RepID=UPI00143EEF7B|nr:PAAR domain-containing protein [Burkholderia multivorans]MBU9466692.1 PAAR domain-containing protein [Burkholderia multivorans]MCA8127535.1 PAAR domain-containing protein [Burkholderia multivorans]QIX14088.1 PAAR domain-containing protein [Burkholderia multivorans]
MRRYDIVKGDTTTVGGIVQGGDGSDVIGEREQAYEHDPVWCPVCKTVGKSGCSGQRITTTGPDGREAALSDDLCLCACPTPPKLVASQSVSYVDV